MKELSIYLLLSNQWFLTINQNDFILLKITKKINSSKSESDNFIAGVTYAWPLGSKTSRNKYILNNQKLMRTWKIGEILKELNYVFPLETPFAGIATFDTVFSASERIFFPRNK